MDNSIADSQPPSIRRKDDEDFCPGVRLDHGLKLKSMNIQHGSHQRESWSWSWRSRLEEALLWSQKTMLSFITLTLYPNRSFSGP